LDSKISEAQTPIQSLEDEQKQVQDSLNGKISLAQTRLQELNMSMDRINSVNKTIER